MAKLASPRLEVRALKGICAKDKTVSGLLLSGLDQSHFYTSYGNAAYLKLKKEITETGQPPTWKALLEDLSLSEKVRERLSKAKIPPPESAQEAKQILTRITTYKQARGLFNLAEDTIDLLKQDTVDMDKAIEKFNDKLTALRRRSDIEDAILHMGKNNNSVSFIEKLLARKESPFIPTGIKAFDSGEGSLGGFGIGSLVLIGGTTGGGKSTLANVLALNMAERGYKTLLVPLEMSDEETVGRTLANISNVPLTKILTNIMSEDERMKVMSRYKRFCRRVKEKGGRYSVYKPDTDISIEELLAAVHTYEPNVIFIDYISLLRDTDGDDQWRKLGQIARYCKIYADIHKKIVVLLCQVNEDGAVRYAKSIVEHASSAWIFISTKETRENGIINVSQLKARNSKMFDFTVGIDSTHMRLFDLDESQAKQLEEKTVPPKKGVKGKGSKKLVKKHSGDIEDEYVPDLSEEE